MTVMLRLVLDQLADEVDADQAEAAREVAHALIATAPRDCAVAAIVPAGAESEAAAITGLADVTRASLGRSALAASWQLGLAPGIGGGLIHAAGPLAPLVRHDRVNDNDQTVVTLWDLCAWEGPDELSRAEVMAARTLLKRAEKHADAVVVPTHAFAVRLSEIAPRLAGRLRVIPGAAPHDFAVPRDAVGRRREHDVPEGVVAIAAGRCDGAALDAALQAVARSAGDAPVLVLDASDEARIREAAAAAGIAEDRLRVPGRLSAPDRAAVFETAALLVAPSTSSAFPWRAVEALRLGVPIVAAVSPVHEEVLLDGALLAPADALADAIGQLFDSERTRTRYAVSAADRGRAFSWRDHAERIWALHAEL